MCHKRLTGWGGCERSLDATLASNISNERLQQSIRERGHRSRRNARTPTSELDAMKGVGFKTVQQLLKEFGSSEMVCAASEERLAVVGRAAARKIRAHYVRLPIRTGGEGRQRYQGDDRDWAISYRCEQQVKISGRSDFLAVSVAAKYLSFDKFR
jgi:hypothetical protein